MRDQGRSWARLRDSASSDTDGGLRIKAVVMTRLRLQASPRRARRRDHHHLIGAADLVEQVLGVAGEIAKPPRYREALAGRGGAGQRGQERRVAPRRLLREPLDDLFAGVIERDDLDRTRPRVRSIDAEARFDGA